MQILLWMHKDVLLQLQQEQQVVEQLVLMLQLKYQMQLLMVQLLRLCVVMLLLHWQIQLLQLVLIQMQILLWMPKDVLHQLQQEQVEQ